MAERMVIIDDHLADLLADVLPRLRDQLVRLEQPTEPTPAALTVAEAAHELRLSVRKVEQMIAAGEIGVVRLGRSIRIPRVELTRLLDTTSETNAPMRSVS